MWFMTTILEKTVILCAQVYLLVIMLMILGLRWWQMMAMKDFQIWVLATRSLPSMPALDTSDEAISSPSLPASQHSHHSCSRMSDWEMWQPSPGEQSPISSPKPPPHNPAVGPGRTTVAVRRWKGWGVTWTALLQLWKSIPSFPSLSTAFVFIPAQEKTSGCLAEGAQKVKIWSNLEAGKFARAARSRALLSHLEWELQAPDCHIKRCQTLWVCFKRKCWLSFQRNVGQKSTPGCRSQADSQT